MTHADRLLLTGLLLLQVVLYAQFWRDQGVADHAVIIAAGHAPLDVSLQRNRQLHVTGTLGDSTLEVHDGQIRFLASPCHGKHCIHSGWLSRAGDFAACLPNRISVTLIGTGARYDAVNY